MKHFRFLLLAWLLCFFTNSYAQVSTTSIELPFSFCGKTTWNVVATEMELPVWGEDVLAYELQDFIRRDDVSRTGRVWFVPDWQEDTYVLVFDSVYIRMSLPTLIDNTTENQLLVMCQHQTKLNNSGTIVRSRGSVSFFGEAEEDVQTPTNLFLSSNKHDAFEVHGDMYFQDLNLEITANRYAFLCPITGDENFVLEFNNVTGKVSAPTAVAGFSDIAGTRTDIEGIQLTIGDDLEDLSEE